MQEQPARQQQKTIDVPAVDFGRRLDQLGLAQAATGALFSRLALLHQVAKAYAIEALGESVDAPTDVEIDEITDPPLYGYTAGDNPVVIQFSYQRNAESRVRKT